jgi:hypothetical protein
LSVRADYKSKPKFVVPSLRLQNHNFQALFVLFHFSWCLSSALLVFTHLLSCPLLSSPHFNTPLSPTHTVTCPSYPFQTLQYFPTSPKLSNYYRL